MFLPVLSHFQNKNPWTASHRRLRCRVVPDADAGLLTAQVWEGPWAFEFSAVEEEKAFPLSEEGLVELSAWLDGWGETVNARAPRSLEENVARRERAEADKQS